MTKEKVKDILKLEYELMVSRQVDRIIENALKEDKVKQRKRQV